MPQFSRKKTAKPRSLNLYWVTTDDHDDDWFVIAASKRAAEKWFEDYEGYDQYAAAAELIMKVPPEIALHNTPGPRWADREHPSFQKTSRYAQIEDLAKLGFIILKNGDHGRTVKLGNRTFMEGHLESLLALAEDEQTEAESGTRPRGTPAINKSKMN